MKKRNPLKIMVVFSVFVLFVSIQSVWSQNTQYQDRPIELGTSGGNINDISSLYCCTGTLGALVQDNAGQYILSNNHVLARTNLGTKGEDIIQPGLADLGCVGDASDAVADLSSSVTINFGEGSNVVDAAIAQTKTGMVNTSGYILDIGLISNQTTSPTLNMPVKKSGRTTGLTHAKIASVDVTLLVSYNVTCGIGSQTATFTNQIGIRGSRFSAGGDSGSLIVEDCSQYPRAVGLLFAGGGAYTYANPINYVVSSLGVGMVGDDTFCTAPIKGKKGRPAVTARPQLPPQANQRAVEAVSRVKHSHEEAILKLEGVVGIGVGLSETVPEEVVIEIYVKKSAQEMKHVIPELLENIPVKILETGEIVAF